MKLVTKLLIYILVLCKSVLAFENVNLQRMSSISDRPSNATSPVRYKRYLDFIPKSRMFFRANVKANVMSGNQLLAFAYGYRANYPIENDIKIKRRDIYDSMEELIDHHGFDGRACILKLVCDATATVSHESGMFRRLFKLIFSPSKVDREQNWIFDNKHCTNFDAKCPLKLSHLTPYTDL